MAHIRITIGTNTSRDKVLVDDSTKVSQVLNDNKVNFDRATVHLNGCALAPADFGKSLEQLGASDDSVLIAVIKTDNA